MQRYLLFALFLSICFAFESFERSSFPKRSGDIIVIPENIQDDSFLVLLDSHKVENTKENNAVHETNVANLISNLVGGPIVNAELSLDESNTLGHSLFNKAKANLVVFVDGVGSDDLTSFSQMKIAQQGQKLQLHRVAYPQDSIATLTTLITGQTPSVHGIVNSAWGNRDDYEVAYTESAGARIFNLNDQMTQTFEGEPLIISASSNFQMTSAVGVNSRNFFGNNFNLFWNDRRNCFDSVHFGNTFGLNVSREQIMDNVQTPLSFEDSKEDFLFVAELAFLENMVKQLENAHFSPLVGDKVPDLFTFSFSSLKNIKSHSASKFGDAVELLDKTLVEIVSKLNLLYSGKVTAEIVFMGTSASQRLAKNADLKARVFSLIKDDVEEESFNSFFPSIYLSDSSKQQVLCTKVRQEIDNDVFCPDAFGFARVNQFVASVGDSGNGTNPTYEAATTFQTVLWMSIIMFLFVLGAIYSIGGIAMEVVVDPWLQVRDTKEHQQ